VDTARPTEAAGFRRSHAGVVHKTERAKNVRAEFEAFGSTHERRRACGAALRFWKRHPDPPDHPVTHPQNLVGQVIYEKSALKQKNIDILLRLMRESAFDCNIHAKKHGIDRYKWAYNLDENLEAYEPSLEDEFTHASKNYENKSTLQVKSKLDGVIFIRIYKDL
jgi:predicted transcriptional regulator